MRTIVGVCTVALTACSGTSEKLPWTATQAPGLLNFFSQSLGAKPELCFDSQEDGAYRVRCDQGTRNLALTPNFEITGEGRALIMTNKHVHLGEGRFASGILGTTTHSAYFFLLGGQPAMRLDQNDTQAVDVNWRFNPQEHSLWYLLDQDISNRCPRAALVMRDEAGGERRICDELGGFLHNELPLIASVRPLSTTRQELSLRRVDATAGTIGPGGTFEAAINWRPRVFDQHRPVVYVETAAAKWVELELHDDGATTASDSPLSDLLFTIEGVEDSSLEGGDTLVYGVDGTTGSSRFAAVLLKSGKPVARWRGPDQQTVGEYVQAGHQLYLFSSGLDAQTGKRTIVLTQPQREALE